MKHFLTRLLSETKAWFSNAPAPPAETPPSTPASGNAGLRPLRVCQVWSHSKGQGEEWLYLRLLPLGAVTAPRIQNLENPEPGSECRLQAVGEISCDFRLSGFHQPIENPVARFEQDMALLFACGNDDLPVPANESTPSQPHEAAP